jgi:HrpA-like RNA helicase
MADAMNTFALSNVLPSLEALRKERLALPVMAKMADFEEAFRTSDFIVVSSGTGSGKSTQLPQLACKVARELGERGIIAVTQPRRLAAERVAQRVAAEAGCKLGAEVGFKVRGTDVTSSKTRLKYVHLRHEERPNGTLRYMTDGMLLAECGGNSKLSNYYAVIVDEAHENSLNLALILPVVVRASKERRATEKPFKVVIMSATIAVDRFSKYLEGEGTVTQMEIPGKQFPVQIFYPQPAQENGMEPHASDYIEESCRLVRMIDLKAGSGDIIVFLPGVFEVQTMCNLLQVVHPRVRTVPLTAADTTRPVFFDAEPEDKRRACFVATNVAETSITIPTAVYVIDTGLEKVKRFSPRLGGETLSLRSISQAGSAQRAGRVGRTKPGQVFRLYTEKNYNQLRRTPAPQVHMNDVTPLILQALGLGFQFMEIPFIDTPATECLIYAQEVLLDLLVTLLSRVACTNSS